MARQRSITPGFFTDEDLAPLSFEARLFFIGLWTVADRRGRLEDRPVRLKALLMPYDDVDTEALLTAISAAGFITRYAVEGRNYIQIKSFEKYQHCHPKEVDSVIPPFNKDEPRKATASRGKPRQATARPRKAGTSPSGSSVPSGSSGSSDTSGPSELPADAGQPTRLEAMVKAADVAAPGAEVLIPDSKPWSVEACDDWREFLGKPPGGVIGKALEESVKKHSWPVIRPLWRRALEEAVSWEDPTRFTAWTFARVADLQVRKAAGQVQARGSPRARENEEGWAAMAQGGMRGK